MRSIPESHRAGPPDGFGIPGEGRDVEPAPSDQLQLHEYLRAVYRRRWLVLAVIVAGVLASMYHNATATKVYEAWATLQIEADPNVLGLERPLVDQRDWMREFLPTQFRILESRELARLARETLERGQVRTSEPLATDDTDPSRLEYAGPLPSVAEIVDGRMIEAVKDTRLVGIGFRSPDPVLAASVANALARAYVQWHTAAKSNTTTEASVWLVQQVEQQRKLVEASEAEVQDYRKRHGADSLGERHNIVTQKLADLQSAVTRARAETIEKETQYRQLAALQASGGAPDTLPAIASNAMLNGLKAELAGLQQQLSQASQQLGDLHPDIIRLRSAVTNAERRLDAEVAKIAAAIRNDYEAARAREGALTTALDRQKAEVQNLNDKAVEYTALERAAFANRELLDSLLQRSREITLASDLPASNARVLDTAEVPGEPLLPRKRRNLLFGGFGGAFLALGLVLLLEAFNTRVTSPDDVRRHLRLRVLGVTPQVDPNGHASLLLGDGAPPRFTEMLQGVRTNLLLAPELGDARTLLVTSAEPGEGKTMTAANLAVSLARLHQRVLLIDADLRKPRLHQVFGVNPQPGLTDVLTDKDAQGAFQQTRVPGLWLLPAGHPSQNPTDLLGSERFAKLMTYLQRKFDWVVFDSPPVLAVTDPCLIARVASGVLFVVGSGQTSREVASAAVDRLAGVGATFVGAMLNRVVLDGSAEYLPYYHRDYEAYAPPAGPDAVADLPAPPPSETEAEPVETAGRTWRFAGADAKGEPRNPWDL